MKDQYEKNLLKQCFKSKEVFLKCIESIPSEELFEDRINRLFWQIFMMIYKNGEDVHYSVITDILKYTKNEEFIDKFDEITNNVYIDESQWEYQLTYLIELYNKEQLVKLSDEIKIGLTQKNKSSSDVISVINQRMIDMNSNEIKSITFANAYKSTIQQIKDVASGKFKTLIETGDKKFDQIVSLAKKNLIVLAAQKKIGKTRYITDMMDKVINLNQNIEIMWFSFEMQSDEMIRLFISREVSLTEKEMLGINYKLTSFEIQKIESAYSKFSLYPITFIDETTNIFQLCSRFERFSEKVKNNGNTPICVIDNLGLIKPHTNNELQVEDDISRMLKDLRDKTEGLIFLLHHMTKESESKFNITEMYKPKVNHIRGSSRLVDFANKVLLLHRPEHYADVVKFFNQKGEGALIQNLLQVECALNRNGDTGEIMYDHLLKYSKFTEKP